MDVQHINSISEIQEAIVEKLRENTYFVEHDIPILAENAKDIDYQIKQAISKIGILVTVATPGLSYRGDHGMDRCPFWMIENGTIVVAETPILNRGRANYATALDTALQVAETLHELCHVGLTSISQSEENGFILVTVSFKTDLSFQYEKREKN